MSSLRVLLLRAGEASLPPPTELCLLAGLKGQAHHPGALSSWQVAGPLGSGGKGHDRRPIGTLPRACVAALPLLSARNWELRKGLFSSLLPLKHLQKDGCEQQYSNIHSSRQCCPELGPESKGERIGLLVLKFQPRVVIGRQPPSCLSQSCGLYPWMKSLAPGA